MGLIPANPAQVLNRADKVLNTVDGTLERVDGTLSDVSVTLTTGEKSRGEVRDLLTSLQSQLALLEDLPRLAAQLDEVHRAVVKG